MTMNQFQKSIKELIDNFLLIDLFGVICFAIFFIFAVVMKINGVFFFMNIFQDLWNPIVVPLISILIFSSLVDGIYSWWRRKWLSQEEDT